MMAPPCRFINAICRSTDGTSTNSRSYPNVDARATCPFSEYDIDLESKWKSFDRQILEGKVLHHDHGIGKDIKPLLQN